MTSPLQDNIDSLTREMLDLMRSIQRRQTTIAYLQYQKATVTVLRASGFLTPENEFAILAAIEREVYSEENG